MHIHRQADLSANSVVLMSDCVYAQADLLFQCPHMIFRNCRMRQVKGGRQDMAMNIFVVYIYYPGDGLYVKTIFVQSFYCRRRHLSHAMRRTA